MPGWIPPAWTRKGVGWDLADKPADHRMCADVPAIVGVTLGAKELDPVRGSQLSLTMMEYAALPLLTANKMSL